MSFSKLLVLLLVLTFGGNYEEAIAQDQKTLALNFIVKEQVGDKFLPAQGFIVIKPGDWHDPRRPDATRLYLTQGRAYCSNQASDDGKSAINSVFFTSTRQNKFFRLPLSGEKSLSKFWVSESLTIKATINSDGTVTLSTKPTRVIR